MSHFAEQYADVINSLLHQTHGATVFYKQEIIEVPGLLVALIITYDGVRDDTRLIDGAASWEQFVSKISKGNPDWERAHFDRKTMEELTQHPDKTLLGYEKRTIWFVKPGSNPDQWTKAKADEDGNALVAMSVSSWGPLIATEISQVRANLPPGKEHALEFEEHVRIVFNFLFYSKGHLGAGEAQSRTADEQEGVEIRDIIYANKATAGFWRDLKDKWSVSEVVVDAKNTDKLSREDLRQLYCYLKPALGYVGIIVCRAEPKEVIRAFNRTLMKNFKQERAVLLLCHDDLRRMVDIALHGKDPSDYMHDRMSALLRSI